MRKLSGLRYNDPGNFDGRLTSNIATTTFEEIDVRGPCDASTS